MTKLVGCIVLVILIFLPFETPAVKLQLMGGEDEMNQVLELMSGNQDLMNWAGYGEEKLSVVTITGRVTCPNPCYTKSKTADEIPQLGSSLPVSGASVAISCGTKLSKKYWIRATTDENGDYSIELPSHLHAIPNLDKVCFAKLLHLPKDSLCRRQRITRKQMIKGIKLLLSATEDDGARAYVADTMDLKPKSSKMCKFAGAV